MSYQVLARKWRPGSFRELVGQEHVLKALVNALDQDRLHHAYLFTGTRGVGKTTIARILARCLNCEKGVSSEPCGQCSACLEIAEGRSVDLLEVDAASRTKVEDTRELLENVQYAPTHARYKVYLIDEVHMLSNHSFNALLKTLEEPPPHVKFLLATTDPQKLPATVLSRCLQFNLKNMPPDQIVGHLGRVLEDESIQFEEAALWLLARAAAGSMRDALSLTDQAISYGAGSVAEQDVRDMLGTVDLNFVYRLLDTVAAGDPEALLALIAHMSEHVADFGAALDELLGLIHRVTTAQLVPDAIDNRWGDADRVRQLAASVTAEDAQLFYQIALNGKRDLEMAPDPRVGFEMTMLRMVAFRPASADDDFDPLAPDGPPASPVAAVEGGDPVKKPVETLSPRRSPRESPRARPAAPAPASGAAAPVADAGSASAGPKSVEPPGAAPRRAGAESVAQQGIQPESVEPESVPVENTSPASVTPESGSPEPQTVEPESVESTPVLDDLAPDTWPDLLERLDLAGIVHNISSNCVLDRRVENTLYFLLDPDNASLFNEAHREKIRHSLERYFGRELSVVIEIGTFSGESPAMRRARHCEERQQAAVAAIEQDPHVQALITQFDGELDRSSILPLDN